jgi:L-ascorbate metabolism protein UlaG (beta-lactamase superfamily)
VAFIVYADENAGIYHSGDTALFGDMKLYGELYRPRVGLINVGVPREHRGAAHGVERYLTGEMTAEEAAMAARWWDVEFAIPCHHDDPQLPEITEFRRILETARERDGRGPIPAVLKPGEEFVL